MTPAEFIPKYIRQTVADLPHTTITADRWNELFTLLITQGDYTSEAMLYCMTTFYDAVAAHFTNVSNPHTVTKSQVGLGNVDNTADTNKPISTAQAAALLLKSDKAVTNLHFKTVNFNPANGQFIFTRESDATVVIDTALEKVATNWVYDAATQSLVLTLVDGTTQTVSLSAFITETEYLDSNSVDFSISDHKLTAVIKVGGITLTMLASEVTDTLAAYATTASDAASAAAASEIAAGESETNALGYRDAAVSSATAAASSASNSSNSAVASANSAISASSSASAASTSKNSASVSAGDSEAYAIGTRAGISVDGADPAYHNNSKYYKDQAAIIVDGDFLTKTGDGKDVTVAFTEAVEYIAPTTGETLAVLWGKVKKLFSSLKSAAFTESSAYAAAVHDHSYYFQGLVFINTTVATSAFQADATYTNWPYRAFVSLANATSSMKPDVVFDPDTATGGVLAPVAACTSGGIYLYANAVPSTTLTIPTITCMLRVV